MSDRSRVALAAGALALLAALSAVAPMRRRLRGPIRSLLDEMERDVQRFSQMVTEYRGTARSILKRAYAGSRQEINAKYEQADRPQR